MIGLPITILSNNLENFWTQEFEKAIAGHWGKVESLSGPGSSLEQTSTVRILLPYIFTKYNVQTILDLPCGDFNWMQKVDLGSCEYIGADIIQHLIA